MAENKDKTTIFGQIYESTSTLWNKLVPVSVEEFVTRLSGDENSTAADRVEIGVESEYEGNEPAYVIKYRAFQGDTMTLKAREKFSCVECKDAHIKAEGTIPENLKQMVWSRAKRKIKKVRDAVNEAGVEVDLDLPSSRDLEEQ